MASSTTYRGAMGWTITLGWLQSHTKNYRKKLKIFYLQGIFWSLEHTQHSGHEQEHLALPVPGWAPATNVIVPPINFGDHIPHLTPLINYQAYTLNDLMISYPD